jgi:hypothetical protein
VFRNGFPEAVGVSGPDPGRPAGECRFTWTDGGFVRLR